TSKYPDGLPTGGVAGTFELDDTHQSVFFTPASQLTEQTAYRLILTGVRDTFGNVADPIAYDWLSFDTVKPFVVINSPVPTGYPLVSGVGYTITTAIHDATATGDLSGDIKSVDFFKVDNGTATLIQTYPKPPFQYFFVGPLVGPAGGSFTVRVVAHDSSGNNSD